MLSNFMKGAYSMYPDFFDFSEFVPAGASDVLATLLIVYFVYFVGVYAFSILSYILYSLGLYTIAMRRGIHHPWLAWIPFGGDWILGSIADQYQYVAKGRVKNRRKVLLSMVIALVVLLLVFFGVMIALLVSLVNTEFNMNADESQMILPLILTGVVSVAICVVTLITVVYEYVCYYDLFQSTSPDNSVVFLVLGIFFSFLLPFFVFGVRKKDLGMPPKKMEVSTPVFRPVVAEPVAEPVYAEPVAEPDDFVEE